MYTELHVFSRGKICKRDTCADMIKIGWIKHTVALIIRHNKNLHPK